MTRRTARDCSTIDAVLILAGLLVSAALAVALIAVNRGHR